MASRPGNFWENDPVAQPASSGTPGGLVQIVPPSPSLPTPQNPDQQASTQASTARTNQQLRQSDTRGVNFSDENTLRQQFMSSAPVQVYTSALPSYDAALHAADNPGGDLQIVYAFAKLMDPSTGVREGEQANVNNAAAPVDQIRGWINHLQGGGRLDANTRANLLRELRSRAQVIGDQYNIARRDYEARARRYGFDPAAVVGEHPGEVIRARREREANQRPDINDIRFGGDPQGPEAGFNDQQRAAYDAFNAANPNATADQLRAFGQSIGVNINNAEAIVRARDSGAGIQPGSTAIVRPPDISDVRGGRTGETADAAVRAAGNAASFGLADKGQAITDTIFRGGTYDENLRRQRAIDDYDFQNHPYAAVGGSVGGALLLPTGMVRAAQSAAARALAEGASQADAIAAARSAAALRLGTEGAAGGAVQGALAGDGDMRERLINGAVDAALGGATGALAARAFGGSASGLGRAEREAAPLPSLVDDSGRLNAPLEEASPAQRVAAARGFGIDLPLGAATDRGGAIVEKGLDIMPASAGVMNDARRGTERQVTNALENVAGRYGSGTTMDAAGQALQRGARNWISRFEEVSDKAYQAIPISGEARASLTNTRAALDRMIDVFRSNPNLRSIFQNGRLRAYLDALTPPHQVADEFGIGDPEAGVLRTIGRTTEQQPGELSWSDLKHFRSIIGEEIGAERFSDSPARSQLRALYGALSEDMRATAAAQGPRALRAFERANNLYREGQERIEGALVRILGDDSKNNPERAAAAVQTIARSGRGSSNIRQLAQIRASMAKGGEWDEVAGALIRLGGQPANSEGRAFNPQTFVQWYSDMSEPARNLLFGDRGRRELRKALDGFVAVNQRLAGTSALRNTSNTAPGITAAGAIGGVGAALTSPLLGVKFAVGAGANYGMARLWTNPAFVRWATGYTRMAATAARNGRAPTEAAINSQRQYLARLARSNPAISAEVSALSAALPGSLDQQRGAQEGE